MAGYPRVVPGFTDELHTIRKFRPHHFPSVQRASIHNEGAIANCMNGSLLFPGSIDVRRDALKDKDIVLFDDIDNVAFDIGQAFLNQGRPDMFPLCWS